MSTPTLHQLKRGLQIAEQIALLEAEMAAIFGGKAPASAAVPAHAPAAAKSGRPKLSAKGLANIRAAQKARWAKFKAAKAAPKAAAPTPAKSGMSAAHKAKLKAAAKRRWAAIRAGKAPNPFAPKR